MKMIDTVHEYTLPAGRIPGQVLVCAERVKNRQGRLAVAGRRDVVMRTHLPGKFPQARSRDRRGRAVVDPVGPGRNVKIPGWNQVVGTVLQEELGVAPGDGEIGRIMREMMDLAEAVERPGQAASPGRIGP